MILGIILLVVVIIVCILDIIFSDENKSGICFGVFLLTFIGTGILINSLIYSNPKAIDVYRGKTTLQITYQDSIPVDTVVVFK